MEGIIYLEKGKFKIFEWIFNIKKIGFVDVYGVCFGKMIFIKLFDGCYFNCKMYVYKFDFILVINVVLLDNNIIFYGLFSLFYFGKVENERDINKNDFVRF